SCFHELVAVEARWKQERCAKARWGDENESPTAPAAQAARAADRNDVVVLGPRPDRRRRGPCPSSHGRIRQTPPRAARQAFRVRQQKAWSLPILGQRGRRPRVKTVARTRVSSCDGAISEPTPPTSYIGARFLWSIVPRCFAIDRH